MSFKLNRILEKDSYFILDLDLCQVRLINNSNFPWIILIPRLDKISEITDLSNEDYHLLNREVKFIAKIFKNELAPDKLNIATIGNVVPQLHVHIVARYKNDQLFPKTVWGSEFTNYSEIDAQNFINTLQQAIRINRNNLL